MSQALYRKWRPARFEQVIGQDHITHTLQNSVAAGRVGHAYLFCGPRGTGKTTTARLLAKAVNCLDEDLAQRPCDQCTVCQTVHEGRFLDLIEIDAASNTGVDDIRDLRNKINFVPNSGRYKVYIIDEVHMLSTAAFNALLKTLEEPPAHAMFILATTEEHKVPLTIKSRCQQFNFRLLNVAEISGRLQWLAEKESLTIEPGALDLIARQGAGSLRDAESLLDQLAVAPGDVITLERAQLLLGTAGNASVGALTDAWLNADGAQGLSVIYDALAAGADARQFCRQMVNHLRTVLLLQAAGADLAVDVPEEPIASWQPQLPLELAFMELLPNVPMALYTAPVRPEETDLSQVKESSAATSEAEAIASVAKRISPAEPSAAEAKKSMVQSPDLAAGITVEPRPSSGATITLEAIKANWRAMVAQVGQHEKNLPALLAMCKPLAIEGTIIILGFDYPIFKEKFDKTEGAAGALGDIFSELMGTECGVRCVVTSEYAVPISKEEFQALAEELGGVLQEDK
jgi:DNA polymerase-3 subunit gamma/tau